MYPEIILVLMVCAAAASDFSSRRIPNALIAAGLAAALMLHVFSPDGAGWKAWLTGMLTGLVLFLPFYVLRGMAAGDVKLMAAVGSFVGAPMAFKVALATFLIGGAWALAAIVLKGKIKQASLNISEIVLSRGARSSVMAQEENDMPSRSVGRLPYGVAIALGTVTMLLVEHGFLFGEAS